MFLQWLAGTALVLSLSAIFLPFRHDTLSRLDGAFFTGQTLSWLAGFIAASVLAFRSAVPGLLKRKDSWTGSLVLLVPALWILFKALRSDYASEWRLEMSLFRGHCGIVILAIGGVQTAISFALVRRAAPTRLEAAGAWAAASSGTLSLLLMQFVCLYDTGLHMALWHILPLAVLTAGGYFFGRRFLKW